MKTKTILWIIIGVLVAVVAFLALKPSGGGGIQNVDAAGARKAIEQGAQVIDVRTAGEYQLGHIAGSINLPVEEIGAKAASWNKDGSYVLYCASGSRSASAQETMRGMGFKNVADMTGGISAWTGPLEKGASTSQQKIPTSGKPVFIEFYTPT